MADSKSGRSSGMEYASFWTRLVAGLIDGVVLYVANMIITLPLDLIGFTAASTIDYTDTASIAAFGTLTGTAMMSMLITLALYTLYFAFMESSEYQATLGKMAMGVKVSDESGKKIGFGRAVGRYFSKFLSLAILGIGFLMPFFTEKKQALHDMIVKTVVVKK